MPDIFSIREDLAAPLCSIRSVSSRGGYVCKSACTVKGVKPGKVTVSAAENEDKSVTLYNVCDKA